MGPLNLLANVSSFFVIGVVIQKIYLIPEGGLGTLSILTACLISRFIQTANNPKKKLAVRVKAVFFPWETYQDE